MWITKMVIDWIPRLVPLGRLSCGDLESGESEFPYKELELRKLHKLEVQLFIDRIGFGVCIVVTSS